MTARLKILFASILLTPAMLSAAGEIYSPVSITPPEPTREFRGAWIATVANIDWPSKTGLTVAEQKAELISLLDHAAELKLNAVIFQIRPACDALYASSIDPWSEYLTGTQGQSPQPPYDPLAFAIAEAHKRGLELHAWLNPFRAAHPETKSPPALNHITRTHPEFVRHYGKQIWLDPGEPAVRQYVVRVVMDVVKRYDVDGVQFDDYFYPYPEKDSSGHALDFPDYATWKKYGLPNGYELDDWRRQNVNQFIQSVYQNIKAVKPWVKFGISPFGIWRPHFPNQIQGLDAYANLYADSRKWLAEGWLDYFAPQLYWPVDPPPQSFPVLLQWWREQNLKGRNLWPGLSGANVGEKFPANEIARQIQIARGQNVNGEIFYHLKNLTDNESLAEVIRNEYPQSALVPASPWLDSFPPDKPMLTATIQKNSGASASWQSIGQPAQLWLLQFRGTNNVWTTEILPANQNNYDFDNSSPDIISIRAVDRVGKLSPPAALKRTAPVHNGKGKMIL